MVILADVPQLLQKMLRDDPTDFSDFRGVFLAHEIAHQWWGHGVAPENYHERWLSEGAAQYAATLWARHAHGDDVFRKILERMSRWALREADEGPIHLGFRLGHVRGKREIYRAVVYDKGAYVLHMLRGVVGEEAFKKALTAFLQEHRYSKVGTDDLRESLEAASGLDLGPYLREWVYGTKVPVLRFSRKGLNGERGVHGVAVTVAAEGLPGPVPLEITVTTRGGRYAERVTLPPHGGVFEIETESDPRKVEINTDGGLLARVP
jgi:aminopeptidase N